MANDKHYPYRGIVRSISTVGLITELRYSFLDTRRYITRAYHDTSFGHSLTAAPWRLEPIFRDRSGVG
jgi:hypothetical protein